jgi:hypothetical protein
LVTARPGHQAEATPATRRRRRRILPDDPLVRWLIWLMLFVSVGAPALAALVLAVTQ